MANLKISVDGSYVNQNTIYGAVVVQNCDTKQLVTYRVKCTNECLADSRNVYGEVAAASLAILIMEEAITIDPDAEITLIFDYEGVKKWATGEWSANKPVAKYYKALWKAKSKVLPHVTFIHQKSHTGVKDENSYLNHVADEVAGLRVEPDFETNAIF